MPTSAKAKLFLVMAMSISPLRQIMGDMLAFMDDGRGRGVGVERSTQQKAPSPIVTALKITACFLSRE